MDVGSLLQKEITEKGLSKNEIIRQTGIDRSTFYQIIRGKRVATREQLFQILNCMETDLQFRTQILGEYEKERVDGSVYKNRAAVRDFMNRVATQDDAQGENLRSCPEKIRDILHHAASTPSSGLQIFLPGSLMIQTGIYAAIRACTRSQKLFVDYLSVFTDEEAGSETMFDNIAECLRCFFRENLTLRVYHLKGVSMPSAGTPYPYYISSEDELLLIGADAKHFFKVQDGKQIQAFRAYFEEQIKRAEPLITSNRDSKDMFTNMGREYLMAREKGQSISFITPCPCIMRTITKEELQKYLPDPQILAYWDLMHTLDLREFTNRSGTISLLETGLIRESGFHIQITKEDLPILRRNVESRLGKDLFLLNNDNIQMSDYWEFLVIGTEKVIFLPFYEAGFAITISNVKIAAMVSDWCESRIETVNADLMRDIENGNHTEE